MLLDPLFEVSGLLWRIGFSVQLAYLVWLPVALLVLFGGFRAYVRRTLPDSAFDRGAALALALALFFSTPVFPLLVWTGALGAASQRDFLQVAVDINPSGQLWGYFPIAIDLGLFAYTMLWIERSVSEPDGRSLALRAGAAALVISWLHPWQGATLIVILLVLVLVGRPLRHYAWLAAPLVAAGLPFVYFAVLPHIDHAWKVARDQNALGGESWGMVLGAVGPIALLALGRPRLAGLSLQARILVIWPLSALFVYWVSPPVCDPHARDGHASAGGAGAARLALPARQAGAAGGGGRAAHRPGGGLQRPQAAAAGARGAGRVPAVERGRPRVRLARPRPAARRRARAGAAVARGARP